MTCSRRERLDLYPRPAVSTPGLSDSLTSSQFLQPNLLRGLWEPENVEKALESQLRLLDPHTTTRPLVQQMTNKIWEVSGYRQPVVTPQTGW